VSFDDQFVDVGGVRQVERLEADVVDDEEVDAREATNLGVVALSGRLARSRLSNPSQHSTRRRTPA